VCVYKRYEACVKMDLEEGEGSSKTRRLIDQVRQLKRSTEL